MQTPCGNERKVLAAAADTIPTDPHDPAPNQIKINPQRELAHHEYASLMHGLVHGSVNKWVLPQHGWS